MALRSRRFPLLMEQIVRHGADVVCLQGLDPTNKSFTWLRTMRQLGYEGVIQDRSKSGGYTAVVSGRELAMARRGMRRRS